MKVYLTSYGLYWVGGNIYPQGTLTAEILGDNIVFSYADGERKLEPVKISSLERENGSAYGDVDTFITEVGGLFKPFISEIDVSAEIAAIMAIEDFTVRIDSPNVYGSGINRGEIEDALTESGIVLPLNKNWKFFVRDANNKCWFITYFKDIDKFATEKMPLK